MEEKSQVARTLRARLRAAIEPVRTRLVARTREYWELPDDDDEYDDDHTCNRGHPDFLLSSEPLDSKEEFVFQTCPAYEDFCQDTSTLLHVDSLQGCRLSVSKRILPSVSLTHVFQLGQYPSAQGSQMAVFRALVNPKVLESVFNGKGSYMSLIQYVSQKFGVLSMRYSSRDNGLLVNGMTPLPIPGAAVKCQVVSGALPDSFIRMKYFFRTKIMKKPYTNEERDAVEPYLDTAANDGAECALKYNGNTTSVTVKGQLQGTSPVAHVNVAKLLSPVLAVGVDNTVLVPNLASISSVGFKRLFPTSKAVLAGHLVSQPNFSTNSSRGVEQAKTPVGDEIGGGRGAWAAKFLNTMTSRLYVVKFSYLRRLSERLTFGGDCNIVLPSSSYWEAKENNSTASPGIVSTIKQFAEDVDAKVGYEYLFENGRVQTSLDHTGKLSSCVETRAGLQVGGTADLLNDDYKFGFAYDYNSENNTPPSDELGIETEN